MNGINGIRFTPNRQNMRSFWDSFGGEIIRGRLPQVAKLEKLENCSNVPLLILKHLLKSPGRIKWDSFLGKPLYASMLSATSCTVHDTKQSPDKQFSVISFKMLQSVKSSNQKIVEIAKKKRKLWAILRPYRKIF